MLHAPHAHRPHFGLVLFLLTLTLVLSQGLPAGEPGKKAPVPGKTEQARAEALIKELYAADYARAAKDNEAKARLALTLLQEGRDTTDDLAGRYVLFREARELAAQAGDVPAALQAVEETAQSFALPAGEAFELKVKALTKASTATTTAAAYQTIIDSALLLLDEATAEDDYDSGLRLAATAEAAARQLKNVALVLGIRQRGDEVRALQKAYAPLKPFADTLRKDPADAKANLVIGKYQALTRGDWDRGLPRLAKGSDALLQALAKKDLDQPEQAARQVELGEGWWRVAGGLEGMEKTRVLLRSYAWYQRALPRLEGQAEKDVEARMKDITGLLPPEYRAGEITRADRLFEGQSGPVFGVALSPDGNRLVSGSQDGVVRLWDVKNGKELRAFVGHNGPVWAVAFAPDGRRVASGGFDRTVRVWDIVSGKEVRQLSGHDDYVRSVAFAGDGRRILSGGDDRTLRLWDVDTGKEMKHLKGHGHFVWDVALSRDGRRALSASLDKTAGVWDVASGQLLHNLTGHGDTVLSVALSPDGRRALTGSTDGTLKLWDVESGKDLRTFTGHTGHVHAVAFAPDGRRALSVGQDGTLRLWDVDSGKLLRRLDGHTERVWNVSFSGDGRWAATCGHDGTVRLWGSAK